jgi:hypothetical protein
MKINREDRFLVVFFYLSDSCSLFPYVTKVIKALSENDKHVELSDHKARRTKGKQNYKKMSKKKYF